MSSGPVPTPIGEGFKLLPRLGFAQSERRKNQRFPFTGIAKYVFDGNLAQTTTRDISSGGVFLKTDKILRIGEPIRILIDWPVLLDQRCLLQLVVVGKVLRSNGNGTAVGLKSYEFRTRGRKAAHVIS